MKAVTRKIVYAVVGVLLVVAVLAVARKSKMFGSRAGNEVQKMQQDARRALGLTGSAATQRSESARSDGYPPQPKELKLKEPMPFNDNRGVRVASDGNHHEADQHHHLAQPLPASAPVAAPGTTGVVDARQAFIESMRHDPTNRLRVENEWDTKAFRRSSGVAETGIYGLQLAWAREAGVLPDPVANMDCSKVVLIGLPEGHPCFQPYHRALIEANPDHFDMTA